MVMLQCSSLFGWSSQNQAANAGEIWQKYWSILIRFCEKSEEKYLVIVLTISSAFNA